MDATCVEFIEGQLNAINRLRRLHPLRHDTVFMKKPEQTLSPEALLDFQQDLPSS